MFIKCEVINDNILTKFSKCLLYIGPDIWSIIRRSPLIHAKKMKIAAQSKVQTIASLNTVVCDSVHAKPANNNGVILCKTLDWPIPQTPSYPFPHSPPARQPTYHSTRRPIRFAAATLRAFRVPSSDL